MPVSTSNPIWPALAKAGLFLVFGYVTLQVLAALLYAFFGMVVASVVGVFAGAALATSLVLRIYERARLADVGLRWTPASRRNLILGFGGGFAAAGLILAPALVFGFAELQPDPSAGTGLGPFLFLTILLVFGALGEELLFRGYAYQILMPHLGPMATLLPMAVLFASVHSANTGSTPLALVNTFGWGVLLGAAVLRSGDLWMPVGLHFGWNWALPLFGVNVSGFTMRLTGHALKWNIDPLWSGGEYGPEGGVLCTAVILALGVFLWKAPVERQELALTRARAEAA